MGVLKVIEILAESTESWEDAVKNGVATASESVNNIESAYIREQSVNVENGSIKSYRVNLKVTFKVN